MRRASVVPVPPRTCVVWPPVSWQHCFGFATLLGNLFPAHVAPGQVAEAHYYLAMALAVDPKQRARARAEANTALAGYQKAHNTVDAERVQKWLRKH